MQFARRILSGMLIAAAVAACRSPSAPGDSDTPEPITALPRALSASEQGLIGASNTFGFNLFGAINKTYAGRNLFISPLSASMALGMTMNGANGTTLDEMRSTLGYGTSSLADIDAAYRSLIDLLRGLDKRVDFKLANSIWYRAGFPFEASFLQTTRDYFDATVTGLDFAAPSAPATINAWVQTATNGKIPTIVDGPIRDDLVMFLINAIYFKGSWTAQFDKAKTRADQFTTGGGTKVPVTMMERSAPARYGETGGAQVVDLPYGGGAFSMTIVLPPQGRSVDDFVATLDAARWTELTGPLRDATKLHLFMPKFRLEWKEELSAQLKALGMRAAFADADFTGMSRSAGRSLVISEVKQKTFVDIYEEGTEAAAVTSVSIGVTAAPINPVVRVDRPFIFAIRERLSGTVLFLGKIAQPPQ
jgi:serine protease inhibitor